MILMLLALFGYFVGGSIYNYTQNGSRGWEVVPNHVFWGEIVSFLHDLFSNIRARLSGEGGYQQI